MLTPFLTATLLLITSNQDPDAVSWTRISRRLDADGNGEITREEFKRRGLFFRRLDANGDGVLTAADFGEEESPGREETGSPEEAPGPEQLAEGLALFERDVLPILELTCFDCHAADAKRVRAGLELDTRAGLLRGGVSGPALAPGDPDHSLFVEAVRYETPALAMPPDGKLAADEIAAIERWVSLGAPWPGEVDSESVALPYESTIDIEAGREWWSFQPVHKPELPGNEDAEWALSEIDRFVLARLESQGLEPVGDAEREAWLRRVTFDLTGLPPTPAELEAFAADRSLDAHDRVVDRLLDSPRYAERWGRHWLDVARYAESSGRDSNIIYPHAWRYRDWVIEAFEENLPYDEFLALQLAGDLLPAGAADQEARQVIATGYLALGPKSHKTRNPLQFTADVVDEQIDAISQGMLGLTVACARCHDHKFDPIPTEDYYSLAGILGSTETLFGTHRGLGNLRTSDLAELPDGANLPNGPAMSTDLRRFYERRLGGRDGDMGMASRMETGDARLDRLRERLAREADAVFEDVLSRWDDEGQALSTNRLAMGARDGRIRDARVLVRGEIDAASGKVARGFPQVLTDAGTPAIEQGSGRLELADWIASPENPLTARVWANRVWSHLFGTGLVATPDNFGSSGEAPTHPELLDWLAATLIEDGWSTRSLIRRIVSSRAYRMDSTGDRANEKVDPEARLLWRMPPRRLEAEALRDAMLFAAGTLELERPIGSPVAVIEGSPRRDEVLERLIEDTPVRSIYLPVLRDKVPQSLECFDAPDPSFVTGAREETIVPTQALYLMNDEDVIAACDAFARDLLESDLRDKERIELAFLRTLSRRPTSTERSAVQAFLRDFERILEDEGGVRRRERAAWSAFVQSLFQSAEFRYRG